MIANEPFTPNRSWFLVAATIAFFIVAALSGYFQFQASSLGSRIENLNAQKESLAKPSSNDDAKPSQTAQIASLMQAQASLKKIDAEQLYWSKIIEKIENSVPKLKDTNQPIIALRSYNGNEDGKIAVSATTRTDSADPFADIALTIRSFATDPAFKEVFIPSITKSLAPDGATVLSFSINFEYIK
ncbi:hypothetical protein HYW83_04350 [Candidatus Peregrinibacteria bacterium]|nr:hypothetical protein [Candidatus Peregrinibacteria bacterium]